LLKTFLWGIVGIIKKVFIPLQRQKSKKQQIMSTFIGQVAGRTDDKGRIFVPAIYRKTLQELGSRRIVMRSDTDNACLIFFPEQIWERKVEELKSALDEWDADDQLLLMQYMSEAEWLDMDTQGRILLQRKTLESIEASQDVLFVGMMDRFALWAPQLFEQKKIEQKSLADKIRKKIHEHSQQPNA
jgi:MraZ protein